MWKRWCAISMIYVTGDTHAEIDIHKLNLDSFKDQKLMTKSDYLIICGDFGLVWDGSDRERWWRSWLSKKTFTTIWVDGNHENFDLLETVPESNMFGGCVQEVAPSVFHVKRGQVLTIDGKKIYSKTYSVTVTSSTGTTKTYDITHNIANISTIWVDLNNSFLKRPNGDTIPLNYYDNSNNRFNCYFNNYDKKTFRMDMWGDFNRGGIVYITFRYTKTTD